MSEAYKEISKEEAKLLHSMGVPVFWVSPHKGFPEWEKLYDTWSDDWNGVTSWAVETST